MKRLLAALLAVSVLAPAAATARVTDNLQRVTPAGPDAFTVQFRAGRAARDYWCAAGEYVIEELNLPRNTRIFRIAPEPPRPQGQSVTFSLSPEGAVHPGIAIISSTGKPGLTASHARLLCETARR